jgi:hypothetical protein
MDNLNKVKLIINVKQWRYLFNSTKKATCFEYSVADKRSLLVKKKIVHAAAKLLMKSSRTRGGDR